MGFLPRCFRADAGSRLQELRGQVRRPRHPLAFSKARSPLTYRFSVRTSTESQDRETPRHANAENLNMAHAGVGSITFTFGLMLNSLLGVKPTTVPFSGVAPATAALLGGQVDYMCL